MIKHYKHVESGNKIKAVQYDGTIHSIKQIAKVFDCEITITSSAIFVKRKFLTVNDYCVIDKNNDVYIYSPKIFHARYLEYIHERKFKCDRRIMIHLWQEVHQAPDMYTVSIIDGFIVITSNITKNKVRISNVLTVTRINPEYGLNSIEEKIVDMCDEIPGVD